MQKDFSSLPYRFRFFEFHVLYVCSIVAKRRRKTNDNGNNTPSAAVFHILSEQKRPYGNRQSFIIRFKLNVYALQHFYRKFNKEILAMLMQFMRLKKWPLICGRLYGSGSFFFNFLFRKFL